MYTRLFDRKPSSAFYEVNKRIRFLSSYLHINFVYLSILIIVAEYFFKDFVHLKAQIKREKNPTTREMLVKLHLMEIGL